MMKHLILKGQIIIVLICILVGAAVLPAVSSVQVTYKTDNQHVLADEDFIITMFGSYYVKRNKPFNFTNGIYTEFTCSLQENVTINISQKIRTFSTQPTNIEQILAENFEFPAFGTGQIVMGNANFGIGFFAYTITIDGCGEHSELHTEKTAYGICFLQNAYIFFQRYVD